MKVRMSILAAVILCPCVTGSSQTTPAAPSGPVQDQRVDINSASVEELLRLPGITATWAGRIVRFRPYHTKNDLLDRGVLPSQVYDRIKDSVVAHRQRQ